ncbi:MAG: AbrB/MazE/SpoVT family DNA-binding domain-containing protein [Deltaproteobacteria bacterium]|jgi:antitoxin MazE|nr:AbrB/MazE/SpoVT family DNA-binding domain-containing protein [Deltaproteobacteria bacterium]
MRTQLIAIGNSRGIRIPKSLLEISGLENEIEMEVQGRSLVLKAPDHPRSHWEEAFAKVASIEQSDIKKEEEEWGAFGNRFDEEEWKWE